MGWFLIFPQLRGGQQFPVVLWLANEVSGLLVAWCFLLVWHTWTEPFGLAWLLCPSQGLGSIELGPAQVYVAVLLVHIYMGGSPGNA